MSPFDPPDLIPFEVNVDASRRLLRTVCAALCVAALAAGCSSASGATSSGGSRVDITIRDFKIDVPATLPSGRVTLVVHGAGPTMHELNIAWTDLGVHNLPVHKDGTISDKENTAHFTHLGELEGIDIGQKQSLTVQLEAGKQYVLYCNMDGHYMADMVAQVTAT
ncbi:MAG: hypothetical protein QOJ62_1171 [Actinomycetota bacterium]|jgi:uncharacterized cupredoxin-like copper-binding protein|nr:hypothetical protein [Actinomycetota bacterium]